MFRFNLQPLLNHRKYLEEKEQLALAEAKRRLDHEKAVLSGLERREQELIQEFRSKQTHGTATGELSLYSGFFSKLEQDIAAQKEATETARDTVEKNRQDLLTAVKKRKSLSKLKASKLEAYNEEQKKAEQNFLNEVGINMFLRKESD